jgi:hypothetical protein
MQDGEHLIDGVIRLVREADQDLPPVLCVRPALHQSSALEGIDERRHARAADQQPLGDDTWCKWFARTLDDALPAMSKVATARGLDLSTMGEPEVTITEVHRLVR